MMPLSEAFRSLVFLFTWMWPIIALITLFIYVRSFPQFGKWVGMVIVLGAFNFLSWYAVGVLGS